MKIMMLDPHSIKVGDRFRGTNPDRVDSIAESFLRFGQLQPIIVDRDNGLVDGLHRLEAMIANSSNEIAAVYRDDMDDMFLREIELEVNIQREEMDWLDVQRAIAELHEIKMARNPDTWTQVQTSEAMGASRQADVAEALSIVKMTELFPEIAKAKSKHQALKWAKAKARTMLRVEALKDSIIDYSSIEDKVQLGDSVDLIKEFPNESIHAIITDPPFGIDYDTRTEGTEGSLTSYKDTPEKYLRILTISDDLYRVLKPNGWLIWFLGITWYERVKQVFRQSGFIVDEIPIIWDRRDGHCFTTRPDRYFTRSYDIALHCLKGSPELVQRGKTNIISVPPIEGDERETQVERPIDLYAEIIQRLTMPGEVVADFFVGSGSCLAAAAMLGRDFIGCEIGKERRAYAITKIQAHLPGASATSHITSFPEAQGGHHET